MGEAKQPSAAAHESSKPQFLELLRHNISLIQRSVAHVEQRYLARVMRSLLYVRRQLQHDADVLALVVRETLGEKDAAAAREELLACLPEAYAEKPTNKSDAMEEDTPAPRPAPSAAPVTPEALPEITAYLQLLVMVYVLDECKDPAKAKEIGERALNQVLAYNRRSLDLLGGKLLFMYGRCYELSPSPNMSLRAVLASVQSTAALRHDAETNATAINLLLRLFIVDNNMYDEADKLVARAPFPRAHASNPQVARYDYYVGRIRAVQLNYSDAHAHLQQAIRRAPQQGLLAPKSETKDTSETSKWLAAGFLQTAYKFMIIVELLMGDLPERSVFRIPMLRRALAPYLPIVQAVRVGDLSLFQSTLQKHEKLFSRDKTISLILRLRHNVIKTGIRRISLAYSRISLADITRKLHLESEEDAEYVIAKAIRDGVIDARIDHENAIMVSNEAVDIYATNEPQAQLQQRIQFCMQLHNDSVKAMRYSLDSHRAELASATAARERERELANEIADGELEDSDEDWP
ncbi:26S proteasome non-ATPase regulatory subunit [Malassezia brasiliensis]|uniref:26S proteasome non-ATPase regulatory subunit n=1 Tax=Malassezia brasiliensis TaxID=1821822 RepID=A0AAF0IMQ7_9BASI|nr:26S proteasome non-ATPase regulatory subunit [Malassezia brasiliensis]